MIAAWLISSMLVAIFGVFWALWSGAMLAFGFSRMPDMPFFGAPAAAKGGVGKEAASVGDLEVIDTVMRHNTVAALDTLIGLTYAKGVSVGNIKVPMGAGFISRIDIAATGDFSNTATNGLYCTSFVQLSGNAILKSGWQRWMGPAMWSSGKTAGAGSTRSKVVSYATKIAVQGGNEIAASAMMCGSDIGDLSVAVYLVFTKNGRDYGIEDSDIREADIPNKDTDVILTTLGGDTLGNLVIPAGYDHIPAFLCNQAVGTGVDYITQTRAMVAYSLGGNAMGRSGFYHYPGETHSLATITSGLTLCSSEPELINLGLPVQPGNVIELHAMMIEEDPGLINVMMGVLYGKTGVI